MRITIPFIDQFKQLSKSYNKTISALLILCLLNFFIVPTGYAQEITQCSAVAGQLFGSGNICIGGSGDIGIPQTKTNQTYTWYQNKSKVVKGPVTGNGDGISYNFAMTPGDAGHYTVVTAKAGCTSTEFGDVTITYVGSPKGLATTSINFDSVAFKWNATAGAFQYEYAVDNDSTPPAAGTFTTKTTASKNSLIPFTNNYIHVRANTLDGGDCEWSTLKFKTVKETGPGALDKTLNKTGKIATGIAHTADGYAEAIQSDGKIVVAGSSYNTDGDFTVVRYNVNGTSDSSFGSNGNVITNLGGYEEIHGVVIQPNGKIVVAGYTNASTNDIVLIRYNSNGTLDKPFGNGGKVFINVFNNYADQIADIALQSNGKIIIAGYSINNASNADIILARLNTDGSLDPNFGTGGIVITDFGAGEVATAIAIQPDDKIIATGYSHDGTSVWDFLTVRYTKKGKIDSSFGTNGKTYTDFGDLDQGASLFIQPSGKIIVAGTTRDVFSEYSDIALAKYNSDGTPDNTFGHNGKVIYGDASSYITATSIVLATKSKMVVTGSFYNGTDYDVILLRYFLNGAIDSAFGYNGKILTDFAAGNDYAYDAAISNGKIVIAGSTVINGSRDKIIVARYIPSDSAQDFVDGMPTTWELTNIITRKPAVISISPNPVKDILTISGLQPDIKKTIFISDITGRILKKFKTSDNAYSCMVNSLPAGIYFACVQEDQKITYLKFMKE